MGAKVRQYILSSNFRRNNMELQGSHRLMLAYDHILRVLKGMKVKTLLDERYTV